MRPKWQRNKKPKLSHQLNSCTCLGALWNSERKASFFQAPARCLWGRAGLWTEGWDAFSLQGQWLHQKKCRGRMMCDSVFKERSNGNAKYQHRSILFLSNIPITTSLNVSKFTKKQKTKKQFSKGMLIVPGTTEFAVAYTGDQCI